MKVSGSLFVYLQLQINYEKVKVIRYTLYVYVDKITNFIITNTYSLAEEMLFLKNIFMIHKNYLRQS